MDAGKAAVASRAGLLLANAGIELPAQPGPDRREFVETVLRSTVAMPYFG